MWQELQVGLNRCGKSCRLRWLNYLKPDIKRGSISPDEDDLIIKLHNLLGNRWSLIVGRLPGRTDNEIKNHWKTRLSKTVLNKDHEVIRTRAVRCTRAINILHPLDRHSQMQNPHQDHKHDSDGVSVNVHDSSEAAQDHNNDSDGVSVNVNDSAEAAQDHNNDSDGVSVNVHDSAEAVNADFWMSSLDQQMGAMDLTDLASFLNSDDDQWFHQ